MEHSKNISIQRFLPDRLRIVLGEPYWYWHFAPTEAISASKTRSVGVLCDGGACLLGLVVCGFIEPYDFCSMCVDVAHSVFFN